DARTSAAGGQRWFQVNPGHTAAGDEFHWTGRQQNWNYACADCHSTGVRKGYDPSTDTFRTTWAAINVSCESCHGPGASHATWGSYPAFVRRVWRDPHMAGRSARQTCAQCHSHRI